MTEQSEQRYLELAEKWLQGTISPAEMKEYAEWYQTIDPNATLHIPASVATDAEAYRLQLLNKINARKHREAIDTTGIARVHVLKRLRWVAAASLIILGSGSAIYIFSGHDKQQSAARSSVNPENQGRPGGDKAILTLANGRTIVLDSVSNGTLTRQGNSQIQKLSGRQLSYSNTANTSPGHLEYNTLTTPTPAQYHLTLPDGTNIWLNSASSVTYPTSFTGKDRRVTITGEVYFEVSNDKEKPFRGA